MERQGVGELVWPPCCSGKMGERGEENKIVQFGGKKRQRKRERKKKNNNTGNLSLSALDSSLYAKIK